MPGTKKASPWYGLSVLDTVGKDTQRERLCSFNGFDPGLAIRQHAWKRNNFRDPAAILLLLDLES